MEATANVATYRIIGADCPLILRNFRRVYHHAATCMCRRAVLAGLRRIIPLHYVLSVFCDRRSSSVFHGLVELASDVFPIRSAKQGAIPFALRATAYRNVLGRSERRFSVSRRQVARRHKRLRKVAVLQYSKSSMVAGTSIFRCCGLISRRRTLRLVNAGHVQPEYPMTRTPVFVFITGMCPRESRND